jgi:hypothetical protein
MEVKVPAIDWVPEIKPGTYSDGRPFDTVHYLQSKLMLKADRYNSRPTFHEVGNLVRRAAENLGIEFSTEALKKPRARIREVVFFDTEDFSLRKHCFILRRRVACEDGFPVGNPEIVFKFRHLDPQTAAEMDVRPNLPDYRIKFKAEVLPLKETVGGSRLLFSHNAQFELQPETQGTSMATLLELFPALAKLKTLGATKVDLVNNTIVEEVLQDLGVLNFGKGVIAKSSAALWRERGDHNLLIGEFSFECKFKRRSDLHEKALERMRRFFISLQEIAGEWTSLGTTKTEIVYRLNKQPAPETPIKQDSFQGLLGIHPDWSVGTSAASENTL